MPALRCLACFRLRIRRRNPGLAQLIREKRGLDKVPVTLDSRHRMLEFSGVTAATPNESEVEQVLGIRIGNDWNA